MLRVVVENDPNNVEIREGEKNGRKWRMVSQSVWIYKPGATFPEKFTIPIADGAVPYYPGDYLLDLEQYLSRGNFGSLSISFPMGKGAVLIPVDKANGEVKTDKTDKAEPKSLFGNKAA